MNQQSEEKYCNDRSAAESAIGDMLKSGQECGFSIPQILDDIKDVLYNNDVKADITEVD